MITEKLLDNLRDKVSAVLSKKRFTHTLGVECAARELGEYCLPVSVSELRAAALLHDIAKELPSEELRAIMHRSGINFTDEDYKYEPLYHAFAAPSVIKERFSEFATDNVLSAVFYHTSAGVDMTLFDEIIFIADFIEESREYEACRKARQNLLSALKRAKNINDKVFALHSSVLDVIDFTIKYLENKGKAVNSRMVLARKAIERKMI